MLVERKPNICFIYRSSIVSKFNLIGCSKTEISAVCRLLFFFFWQRAFYSNRPLCSGVIIWGLDFLFLILVLDLSRHLDRLLFAPIQMIWQYLKSKSVSKTRSSWLTKIAILAKNGNKKWSCFLLGSFFCLGYQLGFCRHHLGHRSFGVFSVCSESHQPITCLISRCPNSPPRSERVHCGCGWLGFRLGFLLLARLSWCWRAKMFTILLLIFLLPVARAQCQQKLKMFPVVGQVRIHFSCWSLNCGRDTCQKDGDSNCTLVGNRLRKSVSEKGLKT